MILLAQSATIRTIHDIGTELTPSGYYNYNSSIYNTTGGLRVTTTSFTNGTTYNIKYQIDGGSKTDLQNGSHVGTSMTIDILHATLPALTNGQKIIFWVYNDAFGANNEVTAQADDNGYNAVSSIGGDADYFYYDVTAPTVSNVTSDDANATKIISNTVNVKVTFSETVNVVTSGGTPTITLETGSSDEAVNYSSGTGSANLIFQYTVASGNSSNDLDYNSTSALALNSGTIRDAAGNDATLTLATAGGAGSLGANKAFIIDGVVPSISSVSPPANDSYKEAETLDFTVNYDDAVTVASNTPTISLTVGVTSVNASYLSGSGTTSLVFRYTVANGHNDSDGLSITSPIVLNGATMQDGNGNNASLTFTLPTTSGLIIDDTAPTVSSVSSSESNGYFKAGDVIPITVTFDEIVNVTGTPQLTVETGTSDETVDYTSGSGSTTLTFNYTVAAGNTNSDLDYGATSSLALNGGTILDVAGNVATLTLATPGQANSLGSNKDLIVDTTAPTVSIVSSSSPNATFKIGDVIPVKITFDENVTVTGSPQLVLSTGDVNTGVAYSSGTGTTNLIFNYTVTEGHSSADLDYVNSSALSGTIKDAAGNSATLTLATPGASNSLGDSKNFVVDGIRQTVSSVSSAKTNGSYKSGVQIDITITFDGAVTVTGIPQLTLETGTSDAVVDYSSGSGSAILTFSYTIAAGETSTDLAYKSTTALALNSGTINDAAGNAATLTLPTPSAANSLSANKALIIDTTAPTVSSVSSTKDNEAYTTGEVIPITITFDEDVIVTGTPTITLETGSSDAVVNYTSGSASDVLTFNYTVASGNMSSDLDYQSTTALIQGTSIQDAAGNDATLTLASVGAANSLGANKSIIIDTEIPTISYISSTTDDGSYNEGDIIAITVTVSEAVTVTGTPRLTLETGTSDAVVDYSSGSGTTILTFNYTVSAGHASSDLDYGSTSALALNLGTINDAAANATTLTLASPGQPNSLGANKALIIDTTAPTVTSVTSSKTDASYTTSEVIDITINFDEAVTVSGTPQLTLNTGTNNTAIDYLSGSATSALIFRYTVAAGDSSLDLDYAATTSLGLNGGSILDAAGNAAVLTLASPGDANSLGSNKVLVIDAITPKILSVGATTGDGSYKAGDIIAVTVTFHESVIITGTPQLTLNTGLSSTAVNYSSGSGTTVLTINYTIAEDDSSLDLGYSATTSLALNSGTINDAVGNNAVLTLPALGSAKSLSGSKALIVDTRAPTVSLITSNTADGSYKAGSLIPISIAFSEIVTVPSGTPQIVLETGASDATINYTSGSSTDTLVFNYTVSSGETSTDLDYLSTTALSLNGASIIDAAGNNAVLTLVAPGVNNSLGANKDLIIDTTDPTVSIITSIKTDGSYKLDDIIDIIVDFDENVYVTGTPQITLETGSSDAIVDYSSGSADDSLTFNYTVASGHSSSDLDYGTTAALTLNSGTIKDLAGNSAVLTLASPAAANSLAANKALVVDGIIPTITSVNSSNANKAYKVGDTVRVQIIGSENLFVTGTPQLSLETGTVDALVNYTAGDSTDTLAFDYIVDPGHLSTDLNYLSTTALSLNSGTIKDEAGNDLTLTLPSLTGTESLASNKNIVIDTFQPSVRFTYDDIDSLVNFEDGTLVITATFTDSVVFDSIPRISVDFPNSTAGDITNVNMARTSGTVYTYVLPLVDNSDGIISVTVTAVDKALNPVIADSVFDGDIVTIDNTDPAAFTTSTVTAMGDTTVLTWFNRATDSLKIALPVDPTDNSLLNGGDVDIQMHVPEKMASGTWQSIPSGNTTNPGAPLDSIQGLGSEKLFYRTRKDIIDSLTPKGLAQGDTIYVRAVINDRVGNTTEGTQSSSFFVLDTLPPAIGTFATGTEFTVNIDTLFSNDSLYVRWDGTLDPAAGGETASGIERFEYALKEGSGSLDGFRGWRVMDAIELKALGKTDTLLIDTLAFEHDKLYTLSYKAVDIAGNTSSIETDATPFLRYNTAPVISAIDTAVVKEDIEYSQLVEVSDIDLLTLKGDEFTYELKTFLITDSTTTPLTTELIDTLAAAVSGSGKITFTPTKWDTANYVFRVITTDNWTLMDSLDFIVYVLAVNDAPIINLSAVGGLEFLEGKNSDTLNLTFYSYDEDNDTTSLKWSAQILSPQPDIPGYPQALVRQDFDSKYTNAEIEQAGILLKAAYPRASIISGVSSTGGRFLSLSALGDALAIQWIEADSVKLSSNTFASGDSTFAFITPIDTNFYSSTNLEVEFTVTDPGNLEGKDTVEFSITPINDPPVWTGLRDTIITENDSLFLNFADYLHDVDDETLSINVLPLNLFSKMGITPVNTFTSSAEGVVFSSMTKDDSVKFKPADLWFGPSGPWVLSKSDSVLIKITASDSDTSSVDSFVIRIDRVPRPGLNMFVVQNNAFTNFYEIFIIDSAEATTDLALEIQSKVVKLDTAAAFTYVGQHQFTETQGTYVFEVRAEGIVGDTTDTRSMGLALAKPLSRWYGNSADGQFKVRGTSGSVNFDQSVLIIDSTLFEPWFNDRASYLLGNEVYKFNKPVEVSFADNDQQTALYQRSLGTGWVELPSYTKNGRITAYTEKMGYFRKGPKTLIVPGMTSLKQNYPNPFNPVTTIEYDLGFIDGPFQKVNLVIYNLLGQQVRTLVNETKGIGRYSIRWNGKDERGIPVSSGMYFVHLSTNMGRVQSKKIMLLR